MTGQYVTLGPLDPAAHSAALWRAIGAPENESLWTWMPDGPFSEPSAFHSFLAAHASRPDLRTYAITSGGAPEGICSLMREDKPNRVIEVGYIVYSAALQRTRAATEAMYLLGRHVFEELNYRRYEWKCNSLNEPSRRAAERLGFVYEGTFRQHMIVKEKNRDTAWFSMLDTEWPARRAAFERWLSPGNFGPSGRQLSAL